MPVHGRSLSLGRSSRPRATSKAPAAASASGRLRRARRSGVSQGVIASASPPTSESRPIPLARNMIEQIANGIGRAFDNATADRIALTGVPYHYRRERSIVRRPGFFGPGHRLIRIMIECAQHL